MTTPIALCITHRRQRGLSLIELMVSLAIGLVLLMGITSLIVQQSNTRDELEKSSRQIENGRYAMHVLHTDLEQAGFYGLYYQLGTYGFPGLPPSFPAPPNLPDPCVTTLPELNAELPLYVQGYDNALPANFTCPLDGASPANNALNYQAGTDILVIRRTDTTVNASNPITFTTAATGTAANTTTPLTLGQVYLQTIGGNAVMGIGTGAVDSSANYPLYLSTRSLSTVIYAPLRNYLVHVYFISPCSVPSGGGTSCTGAGDDNGHPIPTLKLLELGVNNAGQPAFTLRSLVEGIENMQLEYGVDGDITAPAASAVDGYPDIYCTNPDNCPAPNNLPPLSASNPTNWRNVMAIRINVLSRNTQCTTNYVDTKTYQLGSLAAPVAAGALPPVPANVAAAAVACVNGDYKRHVFSELVRLINPSSRRAKQ